MGSAIIDVVKAKCVFADLGEMGFPGPVEGRDHAQKLLVELDPGGLQVFESIVASAEDEEARQLPGGSPS